MSPASHDSDETIYGAPSHMTRSRRQTSAAATAQGDKTMYGAPAPSQKKAPRPTAPAAATAQGGETVYGAPAPTQTTAPRPTASAAATAHGGETVYGAPAPTQTPAPRPAAPAAATAHGGETVYGAPASAQMKAPRPAAPAAATAHGEETVYGAPAPAQMKAPRPTAPAAASAHGEETVYGAPASAQMKVPRPAAPAAATAHGEETVYGAPASAQTPAPRPAAPAAATAHGGETVYGAPDPTQTTAPRPTASAAATAHGGETVYGAPAPTQTPAPRPTASAAATAHGEETVYGAPASAQTPAPRPAAPAAASAHGEEPVYSAPDDRQPHSQPVVAPTAEAKAVPPTTSTPSPDTQAADTDEPLPPGSTIGNHKEYTIEKYLGKGGFGHTYLVRKGKVKHVVKECAPIHYSQRDGNGAIHPIPGCEKDFNKLRDYFSNEVDILNAASGKDKCIVHLVDEFDDNHTKYYVMEYLPGGSLCDLREKKQRAFHEDELKNALDDLLGALEALHTANIIHRDIKPQNIMLTESGDSKLIDFGSACFMWKRAKAIRAVSPHWAPPEEFAAEYTNQIGPHTDLYELGATIYYLITGKAIHHQDLVDKLKCILSSGSAPTIDEVQKLVARYLRRPHKEIMEMKAYSIGFRKALCKALEPDISKRLASAKEWQELISEEKLKAERTREELREIDETIKTKPECIDEDMIKKLQQLKESCPGAVLSLAKCYKYLWRKAEKEQMPKDAKKNLGFYETYLEEARERLIKGAFREAANHLLLQNCGKMDEASLKQAIDWYTQDERPQLAQSCSTALGVTRTYKRLARSVGFTGAHNMYLQGKHAAKECALLPQEGAQNIHPQLRGVAQLLCLLLSCGLCLPLIWLMALLEYKKISHFISPNHLVELND